MKPIRKEVSWKFLDEFRGKVFNTTWPTLPQVLHISQIRFPDRPCFVDFEGIGGAKNSLTYTHVWNKVTELSNWLAANGVKKGDRVAVSGKNSPEWATVYFAAMNAGAVTVPIDYALHENEIENLLNAAEPAVFFVDEEKFEIFSKKKNGVKVFSLSPKYEKQYVYNLKTSKKVSLPEVSEKDTAAILFTSGTTGIPKGVMLSHENLVSDCFIAQQNLIILESDVFYALLPLHHAYTMQAAMICPLSCGASIVFGKSMAVSRLMKELKEGGITLMLGVPLLYNKLYSGILKGIAAKGKMTSVLVKFLMNICYFVKVVFKKNIGSTLLKSVLEAANLTTIRVAICGGGPLASSVFKGYNALGIDFIQGYGLTETSPIIALNPLEHFKIESVGQDFSPWEEIKIINPNEDGIGEIVVKGPMVMQGYYNMPDETKAVFTDDGFFKTGDLGWMDKDRYIMLSGRAKNVIVTDGGKNVYPEEIEDSFQLYYDVEQIMVRSYIMDAEHKSEGIEAMIYPSDDMISRTGAERSAAANDESILSELKVIVDKVNKTLQPYARISKITVLSEPLEMTTTKKVKRNLIASQNAEKKSAAEQASEKKSASKTAPSAEKSAEKTPAAKPAEKSAAKTAVPKKAAKPATADAETSAEKPASKTAKPKKTAASKTTAEKAAASKSAAGKKTASKPAAEKAAPKKTSAASASKTAAKAPAKKSAAKSETAVSEKKAKPAAKKSSAKSSAENPKPAAEKPAKKK